MYLCVLFNVSTHQTGRVTNKPLDKISIHKYPFCSKRPVDKYNTKFAEYCRDGEKKKLIGKM